MKNYIYLRAFIDSPNSLDPGDRFIELLDTHLQAIASAESVEIKRYYKINNYLEIFAILKTFSNDNNLIDSFNIIKEEIGTGWIDSGETNLDPEAIWVKNKNQDSSFFVDDIVWANLCFCSDYQEEDL